jgi:integrase
VEAILAVIPAAAAGPAPLPTNFRDGLRVGEALALHVEDLDLTFDDEHLHVLGKGNQQRTILLDDPRLVKQLRAYLTRTGYRHGPLFRALKNGRGGPLRYQTPMPPNWSMTA